MKKRIISALLAMLMLLSCFVLTGCGEEEETEEKKDDAAAQRVAMTLTMWLPAEEGTEIDDESVAQVEKAINEITQAKFSTAIKFKVFDSDSYDQVVADKIADSKFKTEQAGQDAANKKEEQENANSGAEETKPVEKENMYAAMNAAVFAAYPSVTPTQFDIFLVRGADTLGKYASEYVLAPLTETYTDEGVLLKSYLQPWQDCIYENERIAVPNNRPMGEYEIMLVNKRIASELYYDVTQLNSVQKFFTYDNSGISFIEDAMANYPDVIPVAGTYSAPYIKYWNSKNDDSFSVLSSLIAGVGAGDVTISNTLKNANYVNYITYSKRLNEIAAPAKFDASKEFIVGFTKASYEEIVKYSEKYEVTVLQTPVIDKNEVYEYSFAVSAYTRNVDRSMEIITLINTDPELRTILQYGVEGIHWKKDVDNKEIIHIISDKYKMNINETGNVYMTYPGDGIPMSAWDYAKQQNLDALDPPTKNFNPYTEKITPLLVELDGYSKDINARINAMTYAEFTENLEALRKEIDGIKCVQTLTYYPAEDEENLLFDLEESLAFEWFNFISQD